MEIEGELTNSLPTIQTHILQFYKNLFRVADAKHARLQDDF